MIVFKKKKIIITIQFNDIRELVYFKYFYVLFMPTIIKFTELIIIFIYYYYIVPVSKKCLTASARLRSTFNLLSRAMWLSSLQNLTNKKNKKYVDIFSSLSLIFQFKPALYSNLNISVKNRILCTNNYLNLCVRVIEFTKIILGLTLV